ncbi:MAG: hypothetical protein HY542_05085 [Deltaproteobacteria bacterium]|nr:hypothetical protein [Deltaproteobacteria bacterium]
MGDVRSTKGVGSEDRLFGPSDRSLVPSTEAGRFAIPRDAFVSVPSQLIAAERISHEEEEGDQLRKGLVVAGVAVAGVAAIAGAYLLLRRIDPGAVSGGIQGLIRGIATLRPGVAAPLLKGLAAAVSVVSAVSLIRQLVSGQDADDRSGSTSYRFRTDSASFHQPILFFGRPIESPPDTRVVPPAPQEEKKGVVALTSPTYRSISALADPGKIPAYGVETDNTGRQQASLAGRAGPTGLIFGRNGLKGDPFFRGSGSIATWVIASSGNSAGAHASSRQSVQAQGAMNPEIQISRSDRPIGPLRTNPIADDKVRPRDEKGGEVRVKERERLATLFDRAADSGLVIIPFQRDVTDHPDLSFRFSPVVTDTAPLMRRPEGDAVDAALMTHTVFLVSKGEGVSSATDRRGGRSVGKEGAAFGLKRRPSGLKWALERDPNLFEGPYPTVLFSPPELAPRLVYSPLDLGAIRMPPGTDFSSQLEKVAFVTEYELSRDELPEDLPEIPESEELADATQDEGDGSRRQQNGEEEIAEEDSG